MSSEGDPRESGSEEEIMEEEENETLTFALPVDENYKATTLKILSIARPHMRAFHFAWLSFFLAFFGWFALAPLLGSITEFSPAINLTKGNKTISNVVSVLGTVFMRFAIGPFSDAYGPRTAQAILLGVFSFPVFFVGTSQNFAMFVIFRLLIGFIGAAFVVTQFWTSIMFSGNVVGTANATSAGWGNVGGGVTNILMPQVFNLMRTFGADENLAWRLAQIVPATALLLTAVALFFLSDDLPEGNYKDLIRAGTKTRTNPFYAFGKAAANWRCWCLFLLYAACFGVELTMNGNLAGIVENTFGVTQGTAGLIAGLFGLMNLFARSLGGILSDVMAKKWAMRGRLWAFFVVMVSEALMVFIFSFTAGSLAAAIIVLILFSTAVQMAEGCTFGVVPFVDPAITGAVSGIVGAGGNFGAIFFNILMGRDDKFGSIRILSYIILAITMTVPLLHWPHHGSMFLKPTTTLKTLEDEEEESESEEASAVEA